MITAVIYGIALLVLTIGTVTDLKTREVPDLVNYSLVAIGFFINLALSIVFLEWSYIINSIAGFAVFFVLALIMFYGGQWGGGDSKMVMGLGALLGLDITFKNTILFDFFINMLIAGAVYGLIWSFVLAIRNRKKLFSAIKKSLKIKKVRRARNLLFIVSVLFVLFVFFMENKNLQIPLFILVVFAIISFYMWLFVKAIEKVAMLKYVTPDKLTEGDWIAQEVKYKGKVITGPKDLGIEKKQIKKLVSLYKKKKLKKILIKEGIPFVPSFLIAFIITIIYGNLLMLLSFF